MTATDADINLNSVLVFSLNSVLIGQLGLFRVAANGGIYNTGPNGVDRERYDRHMVSLRNCWKEGVTEGRYDRGLDRETGGRVREV